MSIEKNTHYHNFIGRAIYSTREFYVRLNLQTNGSTETSSLEFLCQLLNDSVQCGRKVNLTEKPQSFKAKHYEKNPTLRVIIKACGEAEIYGARTIVNENTNTELKPTSYELLTPEQMKKLKRIWKEKYSKLSRKNPFEHQPSAQ